MDFSKAFDKVGHERLLKKLNFYGVRGKNLQWIASFLHNRSQRVVLDGLQSTAVNVESGVPQGSVLGPCLFLYYINDLPDKLSSPVRLFADDAITYLTIENDQQANQLQGDLNRIGEWSDSWMMELNTKKCHVITVSRKRNNIVHPYYLNGTPLETVNSTKYLGVTITPDLKWNEHINNVCHKANNTLAFLRRNLRINHPTLKATAYKALVRPLVEYSATVWDPTSAKSVHQLEMVQRRAARFVLNRYHYTSSVDNMLRELEWPTLQQRREDMRLTMMYKLHNNVVPFPTQTYITPVIGSTRVHSGGYQVPYSRLEDHKQSFFPRTVRAWNTLPESIASAPSTDAFRRHLLESRG